MLPRPPSWIWGPLSGRGWAEDEEGKEREREGGSGGEGKGGPKLLLNQGPSEPCYATGDMAHSLSQTLTVSSAVGSGPVYVTERVAVFVRARSNHQVPADHRRLHAARAVRNRQGQTAQSLSLFRTLSSVKNDG